MFARLRPDDVDDIAARFLAPLHDADAVAFRHEVFRDLESPPLHDALAEFASRIGQVNEQLAHASKIVHPLERQRWTIDAAEVYRAAVIAVDDALERASPTSRGLAAVRAALRDHVSSEGFTTLAADTTRVLRALAGVTYQLRVGENRVTVRRDSGEADYGAEVIATFARFRRSVASAPLAVDLFVTVDMNEVETGILERVARLHRPVFRALDAWNEQHASFLDPAIATFAAELAFYLRWLEVIAPLRDAGLPFCYPQVAQPGTGLAARDLFDVALALRREPAGEGIVTNDLELSGAERLLVITGPNHGGKTSFARAIGQLQHLAAIGVPVPGSAARVSVGNAVHTLFARAEDPADLTGRLEAELARAATIVDAIRPGSIVILNQSLESTTSDDSLAILRTLTAAMMRCGATCVVVTFLGELVADDPSIASLTGVVDPHDPTRPTYRLERRPPDPLAHARAVADAYDLGYDAVLARVAPESAS